MLNNMTAHENHSSASPMHDRVKELEEAAITMKAYYESVFDDGAKRIAEVTKQRNELLHVERNLSDAYIRLRAKLNAFDTPWAPTPEQVYSHTEAKLDELIKQRDELLAAMKKAAEEIRRCDYTPARSTLLVAIASVKEK